MPGQVISIPGAVGQLLVSSGSGQIAVAANSPSVDLTTGALLTVKVGSNGMQSDGSVMTMGTPINLQTNFLQGARLENFTIATLPAPATPGRIAYAADAEYPYKLVVDDGTNWRTADGNIAV